MTDEQKYLLLLVDAICGVGFPSVTLASECERVGMASFTGNQWNPEWSWDRKALLRLTPEVLQELYGSLCEQRETNQLPTAPLEEPPAIIIAH